MAVEAAKEDGDDKLAEKNAGGSFGGGLKYSYGHCLYVFDPYFSYDVSMHIAYLSPIFKSFDNLNLDPLLMLIK